MLNNIKDLSKKELLRLIREYNKYIINFEESSKGTPVCIEEFYDNEYQYILYVGDRVRFDNADFLNDEDLYNWLKNNKSINFKVVEVDNESELFWVESNNGIRCPYAISLYENYRRVEILHDVCRLCMTDLGGNDDIEYFVEIDDKFDEKIKKLEKLAKNYESYQEIEDFIYENFILVDMDWKDIEY